MIRILHISDLHIIKGAEWNNMRAALLNEVQKRTSALCDGEKLIIITGDFHNFSESTYKNAENFLKELFQVMKIDPVQDVFIVPGNHDVANEEEMRMLYGSDSDWKLEQTAALSGLKSGNRDFLTWRLKAFTSYCNFARELGIYPSDSKNVPAEVHIRNWREKLNILHLNTALVADGSPKDNQRVDADTATDEKIWKEYFEASLPTLAIGHNSFFDLAENQQTELEALFDRKNVSAYLCGDQHSTEKNRNMQMIRLKSGHRNVPEIPNVVCMKGAADKSDSYSEFGFYWHVWDNKTDKVELIAREWKRDEEQSEFVDFGQKGVYSMRKEDEQTKSAFEKNAKVFDSETASRISENHKKLSDKQHIKKEYFEYLAKELGIIQFEGIPTDKDSGSVKAELENIFVPLRFTYVLQEDEDLELLNENYTIGQILAQNNRVAILAKPGGGKSTLIRRIALAYAYNERKIKVDDDLPDQDWFPVYIRCRDLGENVQNSIKDNIFAIINRAELSQYKQSFVELIEESIQKNQVLLLIDGLDEISNEQCRIRFVDQLQTFVERYPQIHLLITSREAGFRAVASKLSNYCKQYTIADLNKEQIYMLSQNWHEVLLGNTRQAKEDSDSVCKIILQDSRITALAHNPLLLTTLLFVKRWIGYLPTKKCQLYQEMIKLLLVSWNAAAHSKMEMDETEPQLAFVAYEMTKKGKQTIQKQELLQCINKAREALPELLHYTTVSPSNFVNQVEARSCILIQQGMEKNEKGNLVPYYEFSHLSFQEYLAAKAIAEKWLPKEEQDKSMDLLILKEHMDETQWREVIPLTAFLLNRQSLPAIQYLLGECSEKPEYAFPSEEPDPRKSIAAFHLANCIAAEIPLVPELLEKVLLAIINWSYEIQYISKHKVEENTDVLKTIYHSEKYGKILKNLVEKQLFEGKVICRCSSLANVWLKIYEEQNKSVEFQKIVLLLQKDTRRESVSGMIFMMNWAYKLCYRKNRKTKNFKQEWLDVIFARISDLLNSDNEEYIFFASWCVAWAGYNKADIIPDSCIPEIAERLIYLWCSMPKDYDIRRQVSWAICTISQPRLKVKWSTELEKAIDAYTESEENKFDKVAALYLNLLLGRSTMDEVEQKIKGSELRKNRFWNEMKAENKH